MSSPAVPVGALAAVVWPAAQAKAPVWRNVVLVCGGAAALTASAKFQFSLGAVPFTLQTLVVLLLGAAYGGRLAAATVSAYLMLGAMGLPVFAKGGGFAYFLGPTAGYLFGFAAAATAMGLLAEKRNWGRRPLNTLAAMLLGEAVIFAFGVCWLAVFLGDFGKAAAAGFLPFIWIEAAKIAAAMLFLPLAWRLARRH